MRHTITDQDNKVVVALHGDVDLEHSPMVRTLLLQCVERGKDVVVDLSQVTYIDSSGIANLIEAMQTAKARNLGFSLVAVAGQVMRVLELARLEKVFDIHGALADALNTVH